MKDEPEYEPMNAEQPHEYEMCSRCKQMVDLRKTPRCTRCGAIVGGPY